MPDRYDEKAAEVVRVVGHDPNTITFGAVRMRFGRDPAVAAELADAISRELAALLRTVAEEARREERESCAAACDAVAKRAASYPRAPWTGEFLEGEERGAEDCADDIRARGEAQGREGE
jgi:hypothetical protein